MTALAPLLLEPTSLEDAFAAVGEVEVVLDPDQADPEAMEEQLAQQNLLLAQREEIPDSVRFFVEDLADEVMRLPADAALRVDPYLLVSMQKALLAAVRALENPDPRLARRELRVRLEQLRQVYRDLADARPIYEDRAPKELAQWLDSVLDVSQARLAELLGVSPRTLQRWVSPSDSSAPAGADATRVRLVANLVSHLRHAFTGRGVVDWFARPHPMLGDAVPAGLLNRPDAMTQLTRLAASTRSMLAA